MQQVKIPVPVQPEKMEPAEDPVTCVQLKLTNFPPLLKYQSAWLKALPHQALCLEIHHHLTWLLRPSLAQIILFRAADFPTSIELTSTPVRRSASLEVVTPKRTQPSHPFMP